MTDEDEIPVPGVRGMEHTADVGLEVQAPDLPELFRRSALGAVWLVREAWPRGGDREVRVVELVQEDLPGLLRAWLRTLLIWQETEGFHLADARVSLAPAPLCSADDGLAFELTARVEGRIDLGPVVREIKGVTLHRLVVEERGGGWWGSVIFDV